MVAIVTNLCDPCRAKGEEVRATIQRELADNGKAYVVDLCDNCYQTWYAPFVEAIYDYGIPAGDAANAQKPTRAMSRGRGDDFHCIICGRGYEKRNSLIAHEIDKHPGHPDLDHVQCTVKGCGKWTSRAGKGQHVSLRHPEQKEKISA